MTTASCLKELSITYLKAIADAAVGMVFFVKNALWSVPLISAARPFISNLMVAALVGFVGLLVA